MRQEEELEELREGVCGGNDPDKDVLELCKAGKVFCSEELSLLPPNLSVI